jgi:hypothetical protein
MNKASKKKILALRLGVNLPAYCNPNSLSHIILVSRATHHHHCNLHSHPLFTMAGSGAKSMPTVEEAITNMSAQIKKLAAAFATIQVTQETLQGDQSCLTVAINHL